MNANEFLKEFTAKKKTLASAVMTVGAGTVEYGTPQPQIVVRMPKDTDYRHLRAALHRLAAKVELAMPAREGWPVGMAILGEGEGRVYLELLDGDGAETARGVAFLRRVAR